MSPSSAKSLPAQIVPLAGNLLLPSLAAAGYGMAAWRFASDMRWMGDFVISTGLLSRWQVWAALAIAAQAAGRHLSRTAGPMPQESADSGAPHSPAEPPFGS